MIAKIILVEQSPLHHLDQQRVEQGDVTVEGNREMEIGAFGCFGTAWINHDQFRSALAACLFDALPDHRMAPSGVRPDQQDQIRCFHNIFAKGTNMGGNRAGHAQAAVGIDIGAADEALHQLVGDIIILGQ